MRLATRLTKTVSRCQERQPHRGTALRSVTRMGPSTNPVAISGIEVPEITKKQRIPPGAGPAGHRSVSVRRVGR
jgi:hypothetical protein